jgi:pyridoxal phosphate enzyme (YggS family)
MSNIIASIRNDIPAHVKLVAVTKGKDREQIEELIRQGQVHFAENRVQEAEQKWPEIKLRFPHIRLHLIGHLQSNKVKKALAIFDIIETIDSFRLAEIIAREVKVAAEKVFFIQVNIGNELQKSGVSIEDVPGLISYCRELSLNITGIMGIAPIAAAPVPYFKKIKLLADGANLQEVSMGMSDDFQEAIKCGSTEVRLGRALFR